MGAIVIDASAVLSWLFEEDRAAGRVRAVMDKSQLVAPWLWRLEVANAVLVRTRRKMLAEAQATRCLRLLDELPVDFIAEPAGRTASGLALFARPYQLSAYDAVYLDLADRMGLPLLTRDANLRSTAQRAGITLAGE